MATYKVIQDIEAEDKFLGPLTMKQFIFGASAAFFGYLSFFAITKGAYFLLTIFMPPAMLGAFLAIPWSSEQSTEIWVLAKLRFMFKPRARIWDQAGLEELVTITAPKKMEKQLTNGLDPTEVQSRLKALATTIDSRGWAVKNSTLPDSFAPFQEDSDRLVSPATLPKPVLDNEPQFSDMLDEGTPVAENFDHMMEASSEEHRKESLEMMDRVRHGGPARAVREEIHFTPPSVATGAYPAVDEQYLSQQLRNKRQAGDLANSHMQTFPVYPGVGSMASPTPVEAPPAVPAEKPQARMTSTPDPAIIDLAQNNDWNIETIARQAKRKSSGEDEVVVSLR